MFSEDELLPISALQHVIYCERQAALIHLEHIWTENSHTVEGRYIHEKAHDVGSESRGDLRIVRALPVRSFVLGIAGVTDVVEFHRDQSGISLPGAIGLWRPLPVEYKKGKPKRHRADEVQVCAQAICLEEMFEVTITEGALFYSRTKRRKVVVLDKELRLLTSSAAERFRQIVDAGLTPRAKWGRKCLQCSLINDCQPRAVDKSARRYLAAMLQYAADPSCDSI